MSFIETIEYKGTSYALVLRKGLEVEATTFFGSAEDSLQVGILQRPKGYIEPPHVHKTQPKVIHDVQQMLHVTKGSGEVAFFADDGREVGSVALEEGDTVLLIDGGHSLRVSEDLTCIVVKQGPYLGPEEDKVELIR